MVCSCSPAIEKSVIELRGLGEANRSIFAVPENVIFKVQGLAGQVVLLYLYKTEY